MRNKPNISINPKDYIAGIEILEIFLGGFNILHYLCRYITIFKLSDYALYER